MRTWSCLRCGHEWIASADHDRSGGGPAEVRPVTHASRSSHANCPVSCPNAERGLRGEMIVDAVAEAELANEQSDRVARQTWRATSGWVATFGGGHLLCAGARIDPRAGRGRGREVQELLERKGRAGATKLDWDATWRNWIISTVERSHGPSQLIAANREPIQLPNLRRPDQMPSLPAWVDLRVASMRDEVQPDPQTGKWRMTPTLPSNLILSDAEREATRRPCRRARQDSRPTPANTADAEAIC